MRTAAVIAGIVLVLASASVAGEMLGSGEPFEPFVPCALAALGFGIFGLALFVPIGPMPPDQCILDRSKDPVGDVEIDDE